MRIRANGVLFDVCLEDDGTLDTVISLQPVRPRVQRKHDSEYWPKQQFRYSDTSEYRAKDGSMTVVGLRTLGHDAAFEYDFGGNQ
jgi:hypothetical protein